MKTRKNYKKFVLLYLVNDSCVKASSFCSCWFTRAWNVELPSGVPRWFYFMS